MCSDVTDNRGNSSVRMLVSAIVTNASGSMVAASNAAKALQFFLERLHVPLSRLWSANKKELR